jgi:hypothetical protein
MGSNRVALPTGPIKKVVSTLLLLVILLHDGLIVD